MEHHCLRRAFLVQHPQQILIGFAIVNHQRLTETLRQIDVPPETVDLLLDRGAPFELAWPVEIQPGLPTATTRGSDANRSISALVSASRTFALVGWIATAA